jgi:hypothetical protein
MELAMKTSLLFLTLAAASFLFTAEAGARGGGPGQMIPSYPHDSYCAWCFPYPEATPRPRIIIRHPVARHRIHG